MERNTKLLFSEVSVECTAEYLRQWIESRGFGVLTVRLIEDIVSGTSASFAHVNLTDPREVEDAARTLHGQILLGRCIRVSFARRLEAEGEKPRSREEADSPLGV